MCGRYTLKTSGTALKQEFNLDDEPSLPLRFNIAPTQLAPIITVDARRQLTFAQWNFVPKWSKPGPTLTVTNARAETVMEKPHFKAALEHDRCLVIADGFYEWQRSAGQKNPMYITRQGPMAFAGLYSRWKAPGFAETVSFVIITCGPNDVMRPIHDRMPVILEGEARERWLSPEVLSSTEVTSLLVPISTVGMSALQVSPRVNSVAHDDERCIAPAATVQLSLL